MRSLNNPTSVNYELLAHQVRSLLIPTIRFYVFDNCYCIEDAVLFQGQWTLLHRDLMAEPPHGAIWVPTREDQNASLTTKLYRGEWKRISANHSTESLLEELVSAYGNCLFRNSLSLLIQGFK